MFNSIRSKSRYDFLLHLLFFGFVLSGQSASAIDLAPGDIEAPPSNVEIVQLSYQNSERGNFYLDGRTLTKGSSLLVQQWQLRVGHSLELVGRPGFVYVETPLSSIQTGGTIAAALEDKGIGDTTFLLALWPHVDRANNTYLAVGAYLQVPTGNYRSRQPFNTGANRYSGALQVAYQTAVSGKLDLMAAVDSVWFGPNREYGQQKLTLDQEMLLTAQIGLRYKIGNRYGVAGNTIYSYGGETSIASRPQNNPIDVLRYQLTAYALLPFGRLSLQYGADLETRNGFLEERRWIVRYLAMF